MKKSTDPNLTSRAAWDANAEIWDARMGETGNDFFRVLQWPVISPFLAPRPTDHILDIACGNGLTSRMLAGLGASVTAFDFSARLIELAQTRPNPDGRIHYYVLDATDESSLLETLAPLSPFDSALCNMALFDIAEIQPLYRTLAKLLKNDGVFVFSITHPALNNPSCVHLAEQWDDGKISMRYSVKLHRYMTPYQSGGVALRNQPEVQLYFHRPLEYYLKLGFQNGFVLDGFEERAFPPDHPQNNLLSWGGRFSEIPPVLVARMRLVSDK